MIRRDDVRYVQAQGDYARLHTDEASYLVRVPMADLERQWADAGFVRIHRSYLVALAHVTRIRLGAEPPDRHRRRRRAAGEPAPAAGPARDALEAPTASGRGMTGSSGRRAGAAVRTAGAGDRAADRGDARSLGAAARRPARGSTPAVRRAAVGGRQAVYVRSLIRSQLRLADRLRASASSCRSRRSSLVVALVPLLDDGRPRPACRCRGCCSASAPTRCDHRRRRALRARAPRRNEARYRSLGGGRREPRARLRLDRRGRARHGAHRVLRAAGLAHDERLLRRLAHRAAVVERLGDRRRVPLGGERSSASPGSSCCTGSAALLVPDRLHGRLPHAAAVRRGAAAPLGRVHDPRLHRGAARVAVGAAASPACS